MAVGALLLDTSAYALFKRRHFEVLDLIRKANSILVPVVVLGELLAGFEVGSRQELNRKELDEFLRSPRVRVIQFSHETPERYAKIYAYLRRIGRPVPTNGLWIAAVAMEQGVELLTADTHFLQIPQIIVRHIAV